MELTGTLLRTLFMYFFIFLIMRVMGKREIGKLSVFDLGHLDYDRGNRGHRNRNYG